MQGKIYIVSKDTFLCLFFSVDLDNFWGLLWYLNFC